MSDAPTPIRPALRRIAIVAFAILLPIAAHSLWDYIEVRRLVQEIEHIRALGEPVTERDAAGGDARTPTVERGASDYYLAGAMLALGTNRVGSFSQSASGSQRRSPTAPRCRSWRLRCSN